MKNEQTTMGGKEGLFPKTRWTVLNNLSEIQSPQYRENLNFFISEYWKPAYCYIYKSWNTTNEEAKDLTQSFFISILERKTLENLSPTKGSFRSFVKACLKNFLLQHDRDSSRLKRGGTSQNISINWNETENIQFEDHKTLQPDEVFDNEWTATLIKNGTKKLEQQLNKDGKIIYFKIFSDFYFSDTNELSYDHMSQKYKISKIDVGNYMKAARKMFKDIIKEMIMEYVDNEDEFNREFRALFGAKL